MLVLKKYSPVFLVNAVKKKFLTTIEQSQLYTQTCNTIFTYVLFFLLFFTQFYTLIKLLFIFVHFLLSKRYTYPMVARVRREFMIFRLDSDGIFVKIEPPGENWQEEIGDTQIGASIGLIIKNNMELKISKLRVFLNNNFVYF